MSLHLCTEDPCPVKDRQIFEILNNGFTTTYTNMPNKELLLRYAWLKTQTKKLEVELEMIKDQVLEEVQAVIGDTEQQLSLQEYPGCTITLAKARAKWEYTAATKAMAEEVKEIQKEEEQTGKATNLNEGKKQLMFNQPKE